MGQKGLDLGAEDEGPRRRERVVEGLDPQTVSDEDQAVLLQIRQGEGVHSPEPVREAHPVLFVEPEDDLRVGLARETVLLREGLAVLLVGIELPVVDDQPVSLLVEEGLGARGEVDDAQPPHPQGLVPLSPSAVFVGTPVEDRIEHLQENLFFRRSLGIGVNETGYSAHGSQVGLKKSATLRLSLFSLAVKKGIVEVEETRDPL